MTFPVVVECESVSPYLLKTTIIHTSYTFCWI